MAKDNDCLFFEISAKEMTNVQKMLYFSIAELPFFENFKSEGISDLVEVLEMENNETKNNMSSSMIDTFRNDTTLKNSNSPKYPRQVCKC